MSILLEANKTMTFTASDVSDGAYWVIGNPGDSPSDYNVVAAGESAVIGPFNIDKMYEIKNLTYSIANVEVVNEDDMVSDDPNKIPTQKSVKTYVDTVQAGLIADGVTAWQSGIESDISDLQADDTTTIHESNTVADLTALGITNIATIANDATGTAIATAVNAIIAALISAGIVEAP